MDHTDHSVTICLTQSEAIVLFEFLHRHDESGSKQVFIDQAEQRICWDLIAVLEKQLFGPMVQPDYEQRVAKAREEVRDKE